MEYELKGNFLKVSKNLEISRHPHLQHQINTVVGSEGEVRQVSPNIITAEDRIALKLQKAFNTGRLVIYGELGNKPLRKPDGDIYARLSTPPSQDNSGAALAIPRT